MNSIVQKKKTYRPTKGFLFSFIDLSFFYSHALAACGRGPHVAFFLYGNPLRFPFPILFFIFLFSPLRPDVRGGLVHDIKDKKGFFFILLKKWHFHSETQELRVGIESWPCFYGGWGTHNPSPRVRKGGISTYTIQVSEKNTKWCPEKARTDPGFARVSIFIKDSIYTFVVFFFALYNNCRSVVRAVREASTLLFFQFNKLYQSISMAYMFFFWIKN